MAGKKKKELSTKRDRITWKKIVKQRELVLLSIPFVVFVVLFNYVPLVGWIMAFQNYKPAKGILKSKFVGLDNFKFLFVNNKEFLLVIRNTLAMGIMLLVFSTVVAIVFALLLNEVRNMKFKKFVQTVSYLPHFLSIIIIVGIVRAMLSIENGVINDIFVGLHIFKEPLNFLSVPSLFWWIITLTNLWKETGWNSIIYLASITSINPDLYEAASIDGAGRLRKMWNITLPGIKPTIIILLIINIGNVLNVGFEMQYLLENSLIQDVSRTIDVYVLKYGIALNNFSRGTAAGIFKSVVSIILIFLTNRIAKAAGEENLF